jgi:hypothetical protein
MAKQTDGPYVAAAMFCTFKGSAPGLLPWDIQIIEEIPLAIGAGEPGPDTVLELKLPLFLILRSGDAPGKHRITITYQYEDRQPKKVLDKVETFPDDPGSGSAFFNQLEVEVTGGKTTTLWFDVLCDGRLLTRMPLRILISREKQGRQNLIQPGWKAG